MKNNNASSIGTPQGVPHIPHNQSPNNSRQHHSGLTPTEQTFAQAALGTTGAGVVVTGVDTYRKDQRAESRHQLNLNTKAVEIRDAYQAGKITQTDAIYELKNLTLTDQQVVKHLRSVKKINLDPETDYCITEDWKLVPITTSKDGKIADPFFALTPNKAELSELNDLQGDLHEGRGIIKQQKADLSSESPLHPSFDEAIAIHDTAIKDTKNLQLFNASPEKGNLRATHESTSAIRDKAAQARTNVNDIMRDHNDNVPQHEVGNIIHPEKVSSRHHRGAGKGPIGSITNAFIENDLSQHIAEDSQHFNPDLSKNPVFIVSERGEGFDRPEQRLEEGVLVDKPFSSSSSSNTFSGSVMLFGLAAFLWAGFFYFRIKRLKAETLGVEESVFQGKDNKIITFENIIIQFKRNKLSFKEAKLLLINNFTFAEVVAEEILLKL